MKTCFIRSFTKYLRGSKCRELYLLGSLVVILTAVLIASTALAQDERPENAVGYYTRNGEVTWIVPEEGTAADMRGLSLSDIEKLYPMSRETETSIVHPEVSSPVVVDGVLYPGKEIGRFNGQRLYFTVGEDGTLYAFTSAAGLEEYQAALDNEAPLYPGMDSLFFEHNNYGGYNFAIFTGQSYANLSGIGFDNILSSAQISVTATWAYPTIISTTRETAWRFPADAMCQPSVPGAGMTGRLQ